jgi:hypothetical protein
MKSNPFPRAAAIIAHSAAGSTPSWRSLSSVGAILRRRRTRNHAAVQKRLGLTHDPTVTGEQAQAISLASGIRPEDRVLSREILRVRREEP